ncbi:MAG: DNA-methyltransferase [Nannocystales bacterium]
MTSAILDTATGPGWELRLGNSLLDAWPECDHVFTDTPYCKHVHSNHRTSKVDNGRSNVQIGFRPFDTFDRAMTAIKTAQVVRRWVLLFTDAETVREWNDALEFARVIPGKNGKRESLRPIRTGTWHKPGCCPQLTGDRPGQATESVVIGHPPGRMKWNGGGLPAFWSYPARDGTKRIHQTQKPIPLLERMIEQFTDPGDLILDPFAGSASSGVAAIRTGRRWLGWELDPDMFGPARRRLESTREQRSLPLTTTPKARQEALSL